MALSLKLLDHININGRLHVNFACDYSEDGKIFILAESGVVVLTLKGRMESMFPRITFKKDHIKLTETSICENLDLDVANMVHTLPRNDMYEVILDPGLSGNDIYAPSLTAKPLQAMWSPRGIIEKTDGALAVLTNLYNIEIYVEIIDENEITTLMCVGNFAKDITDYYKRVWRKHEGDPTQTPLEELKSRVELATPSAFTWSHIILKDRKACCVLFVGHRDGAISAWRFVERKITHVNESKLEFLGRYNTKLKKIVAMHWFCRKSDAGGLSFGDEEGGVGALSVSKLSTDQINFTDEVVFNSESDLKVEKITIITHLNVTYLIGVKHNYLFVYGINGEGEVFQGKLLQVGNLYITGLLHYENNSLLVISVCGLMKQINLSVVNNEISFTEHTVQLDIDSNRYRVHGFLISPNKIFLGVLAYPCKLKDVTKAKGLINFFVFRNLLKDPFQMLMNATANSLRDYWDCFETLRVKCLQEKCFPWEGIDPDINYDSLPILKFKILRWIAKLSENIYEVVPRVSEYHIKPYVLLNYALDIKLAVQRMTKLLNIYISEQKLSLFQRRSLDLLNFFLKEMVAKNVLTKADLGETFVNEIFEVMQVANELQYPPMPQCMWCGEKIIGSACVPFHADSRCAISLMPIGLTPGYKCPFCSSVVHKEMDREYYPMFCPYCDVPMKRRCFEKRYKKSAEEKLEVVLAEEVVVSDCHSDCLKEDVNDLEDNPVNYIILTDSEDDEQQEGFYKKIKQIVISSADFTEDETEVVEERRESPQRKNNEDSDEDYDENDDE